VAAKSRGLTEGRQTGEDQDTDQLHIGEQHLW